MLHINADKRMAGKWAIGIGLFIFLLAFVAMPALNDALNNYNDSVTRSVAYADSTQQYNKVFLNPFYVNALSSGGSVNFTVNINPPDNVESVISAIIGFNAQINGQTQNFTLKVNGQSCIPSSYYVATAFSTTGNIQFYFDCTNVIKKSGIYSISLASAVNTGSISGWLDITYMNNPKGQVKYVGGTDYWKGETATVFVQLQDANGNAVNNASCSFDMYNTTNPLLNPIYWKQPMVFRGADGIYYYQFSTTGLPSGVYPLDAECSYVYDNFFFWHQSLTDIINWTVNTGTYDSGTAFDMNFFDDQSGLTFLSTTVGAARAFNVTFRFDNISSNITQLDYYWQGEIIQSPAGSIAVTWYALNKTSNSYNIVLGTQTIASTTSVTGQNALFTARIPADAFQNSSNVSIQVWATSGNTNTRFYTDWQTLKAFRNTTYVTGVKGSSEVHIYPINITDMPQMVWNYTNRTLTEYNTSQIYNALVALQNNQNTMNNTVTQILGLSHQINLTTLQTLQLAQSINLTTVQTLQLLQYMNITLSDVDIVARQINLTVNDIKVIVNNTNFTVNQILALSQFINLTTEQTLALAYDINLTSSQIFTLLQYMNQTQYTFLTNINNTVTFNKNGLQYLANLSQEINSTTHNNALTLQEILGLANETNLTTQQILSLLQQVNATVNVKLDGLNNSASLLLNITGEINSTTHEINVTVNQILSEVQGINTSFVPLLQEINATVHYNNLTLQQVLSFVSENNLTLHQTYDLLSFINVTFEGKLDNINITVNGIAFNLSQVLDLANNINMTTSQTYQLLQSMNLTQTQIWSILLGMNSTVTQILNLSNLTYIKVGDIFFLASQTNSTVNQILGLVQSLNISINQTLSGNITLSTNLTSAAVSDISEKVWLQFLTLGTPPLMPSTSYSCVDNVTLAKNITFDVCSTSGCKEYSKLTNEFCEFGCDPKNNQCVPPPINRMGFVAVVFIGIIAFIIIVRRFT